VDVFLFLKLLIGIGNLKIGVNKMYKEKVLFDDWFKIIDHQERWVHLVIVEDEFNYIKLYENGILRLKKDKNEKRKVK